MSERHEDTLTYFIAPGVAAGGDGTVDRPFGLFGRRCRPHRGIDGRAGPIPGRLGWSWCVVAQAGGGVSAAAQAAVLLLHRSHRRSGEGDGSEMDPWPTWTAASRRCNQGFKLASLNCDPHERLCIVQREVFTATGLETWKRRKELIARYVFMGMALVCVLPVDLDSRLPGLERMGGTVAGLAAGKPT